jgi:flagellar biosynthesis/type III secretory pathway M-ring protein FliF/YscJ
MPALPLDEAGKYVAAAYLVFLTLVLIYVAIMAAKVARIQRELSDLADFAEKKQNPAADPPGADAGADQKARAEGDGNVFERERSSREELV